MNSNASVRNAPHCTVHVSQGGTSCQEDMCIGSMHWWMRRRARESAAHIRPPKFVACVDKAQGLSSLKRVFASSDGLLKRPWACARALDAAGSRSNTRVLQRSTLSNTCVPTRTRWQQRKPHPLTLILAPRAPSPCCCSRSVLCAPLGPCSGAGRGDAPRSAATPRPSFDHCAPTALLKSRRQSLMRTQLWQPQLTWQAAAAHITLPTRVLPW